VSRFTPRVIGNANCPGGGGREGGREGGRGRTPFANVAAYFEVFVRVLCSISPYRQVSQPPPARASSPKIRAIYLEHRLAAQSTKRAPASSFRMVINGLRADCAFHSAAKRPSRTINGEERERERERVRREETEEGGPNRTGTATWRVRVSPAREKPCPHRSLPSPVPPIASRSILSKPSDRQFSS